MPPSEALRGDGWRRGRAASGCDRDSDAGGEYGDGRADRQLRRESMQMVRRRVIGADAGAEWRAPADQDA